MNVLNLIGRLTKGVELKESKGTKYARFTLAVKATKEHTDFINCIAFDKTAELLDAYTDKGNQVGITAHVHTSQRKDREGKTVFLTDIVADRLHLLSEPKPKKQESLELDKDDLPF